MAQAQYGDHGEEITLDNETGDVVTAGAVGLQAITSAEINQAVLTAKQFPRRRDKEIMNEIMGRATLNEQIAEKCNYLLPRGGKKIPGPSIRFAEIVRASYWNIRVAARFVALDTADMERAAVIVEAVALDVETNQSEIVPVRRSIMSSAKEGRRPQIYSADMINQTMQAAVSIARRNAILTVVPQALWISGYERVVEVLKGTVETLAARRVVMIGALQKAGVEPEQLFEVLGVKDETDIKIDHMPFIRGMMTAIREGEPVDSVLGRTSPIERRHETVKNPLKDDEVVPLRGNMDAVNQAYTVIDSEGSVRKFRDAEAVVAPVVDQRFRPVDQLFENLAEWAEATAKMPRPVFPGGKVQRQAATSQNGDGANREQTESSGSVRDQNHTEADGISETIARNADAATQGAQAMAAAKSSEEPAENDADGVVREDRSAGNNAQQAAASGVSAGSKPSAPEKPYTDGPSYDNWMRDAIDAATTKSAVTEPWGSSRADRGELLSAEQIEDLTKYKEAKLKKLKGGAA